MRFGRALNLIDLITVLAIGGVVLLVVIPAFAYSKDGANAKSCLSNLKQIGEAVVMYADDNNQALVPAVWKETMAEEASGFPSRRVWRRLLRPYVKSDQVFRCPAAPLEAASWGPVPQQDLASNFGLNNQVCSNDSDFQGRYVYKRSQYRNPAGVILVTEVKNGLYFTNYQITTRSWINAYAPYHHQNRIGVLFMDGHAKITYLWDTIGSTTDTWMWSDPLVNGSLPQSAIAPMQQKLKAEWPSTYPKP